MRRASLILLGLFAPGVSAACAESAEPAELDAGIDAAIDATLEEDAGDAAAQPIEDEDGVLRITHSGSRLSVIALGAPDGEARVPLRIYDEELEITCTIGEASDGTLRCIPVDDEASLLGFGDPACTDPRARGRRTHLLPLGQERPGRDAAAGRAQAVSLSARAPAARARPRRSALGSAPTGRSTAKARSARAP